MKQTRQAKQNQESGSAAAANVAGSQPELSGKVIRIDEGVVRKHLDRVVVRTVEETLNAPLQAEADVLCGAKRYEHSAQRVDTRAGHYERQLHTKAGK